MMLINGALIGRRLNLSDEKVTQGEIAQYLDMADVRYSREHRLGDGEIVDFLVADHIALEVKLRCPRKKILRQLARYAVYADVHMLILASNTAIALPDQIQRKPVIGISLGKAWL
nr:hypothetical protein [uncultured Dongia sp.]